jgi:8-oxo-dGTP pyrophosphatase MutT (NUDIX family)
MNELQKNFIKAFRIAIQNPLPGLDAQYKMAPPYRGKIEVPGIDVKKGAVKVLFVPRETMFDIILIRRTEDKGVHSGQISLPGGRYEINDYTYLYTAIRETQEEIGINDIEVLGSMTPLFIPPSNFIVYPFVALVNEGYTITESKQEVKEVLYLSIKDLLDLDNKQQQKVLKSDDKSIAMQVKSYTINEDNYIWGATAMILSELEEIIKRVYNV